MNNDKRNTMNKKKEDKIVLSLSDQVHAREISNYISKLDDKEERKVVRVILRKLVNTLELVYSQDIQIREVFFAAFFHVYNYLRSHDCLSRKVNGFNEEEKNFLRSVLSDD